MNPVEQGVVDIFYGEAEAIREYLSEQKEVSFLNTAVTILNKNIVLAAGSFFETMICDGIQKFADRAVGKDDHPVSQFLKNKAIKRQYHSYFRWDVANANHFYGLFGEQFKAQMERKILADSKLEESVQAFLALGLLRNELVHQNFAVFSLSQDASEIYAQYKKAHTFVVTVLNELQAYADALQAKARLEAEAGMTA